jgi:rhamnosyltransferase
MTERLGVFAFYDKSGIVDDYVIYLLSELRKMTSCQIVVVNGEIKQNEKNKLRKYVDKIIVRDNMGYDGGAYQDFFVNHITQEELKRFDEVILLNNTFYGPFYSFESLWKRFDDIETDFWGMTRYPGGIGWDGYVFSKHIESYFLVVRRRMLESDCFLDFWKNEVHLENDYMKVVEGFEDFFTVFFEQHGFRSTASTDLSDWEIPIHYREVPYSVYSYELIQKGVCPFLKRKVVSLTNQQYDKVLMSYEYVKNNTDYDVSMIRQNVIRMDRIGQGGNPWGYAELEKFYAGHKRVFLFGAGRYGKNLARYFSYRNWKVEGVFVSTQTEVRDTEKVYDKNALCETDGLIVAMNYENALSVSKLLVDSLKPEQLLFPRR